MKRITSILLSAVVITQVQAQTFYDQLCAFNPNWMKYEDRAPEGEQRSYSNDWQLVQDHLESVIEILEDNSISGLNESQIDMRLSLIEELTSYCKAGVFPVNYYQETREPVFIDEYDTHCAVGYLLKQSGHGDLARKIARSNNYAWVKEISVPELLEWQKQSGFTVEELKLIQGAYDFYLPDAFLLPNKYEVPQKPEVIVRYFDNKISGKSLPEKDKNLWCYGEGDNGVLNGKWIQNYAVSVPWIEGYFENGNRTGQWKEYYQGTDILCRTENWRNDELNGLRTRYDYDGNIIEKIWFKDGLAVTKTNYDFEKDLMYVRQPLDSVQVFTEVYDLRGGLLASGIEIIHNPGNLMWFQNIELTALNSAAITARTVETNNEFILDNGLGMYNSFSAPVLYNSPKLVEYKKEGSWTYYREYLVEGEVANSNWTPSQILLFHYPRIAEELQFTIDPFEMMEENVIYDSIEIIFNNDNMTDIIGHHNEKPMSIHLEWYDNPGVLELDQFYYYDIYGQHPQYQILKTPKTIGRLNQDGMRIGTWLHYDRQGTLFKEEKYLVPWKEEEEVILGGLQN